MVVEEVAVVVQIGVQADLIVLVVVYLAVEVAVTDVRLPGLLSVLV